MKLIVNRFDGKGAWYIFVVAPTSYSGLMLGEFNTETEQPAFLTFGDRVDAIKFCIETLGIDPENAAELRAA